MLQYTSKQCSLFFIYSDLLRFTFNFCSSLIRSSAYPLIRSSAHIHDQRTIQVVKTHRFRRIRTHFQCKNVNTDEVVAVKLEPTAQTDTLTHEAAVLQHLSNIPGIPTLRYYGIPDHNRYMVIDLYDKTLQTVSYEYKKAVPVALVRAYALQMMQILSAVHEKGFVHRDIKPENFMIKRRDGDNRDGDDASPFTWSILALREHTLTAKPKCIVQTGFAPLISTEKSASPALRVTLAPMFMKGMNPVEETISFQPCMSFHTCSKDRCHGKPPAPMILKLLSKWKKNTIRRIVPRFACIICRYFQVLVCTSLWPKTRLCIHRVQSVTLILIIK